MDGKLRRYGPGPAFAKEQEVAREAASGPILWRSTRRGGLLAVGFDDTTAVDVYDAGTLAFRFAADTKGVDNGNTIQCRLAARTGPGSWRADSETSETAARKILS